MPEKSTNSQKLKYTRGSILRSGQKVMFYTLTLFGTQENLRLWRYVTSSTKMEMLEKFLSSIMTTSTEL